ncbi:MAG: hypothetical protein U1U88_001410 [Lawsonella clevelandensis]
MWAAADQLDHMAHRLKTEGAGPSSQLMADLNKLDTAATDLDNGQLPGKLGQLTDGVNQLNNGAHELSTGLHTLHNGTGQLVTGVNQLHDGSSRLSAGANAAVHEAGEGASLSPSGRKGTGSKWRRRWPSQ